MFWFRKLLTKLHRFFILVKVSDHALMRRGDSRAKPIAVSDKVVPEDRSLYHMTLLSSGMSPPTSGNLFDNRSNQYVSRIV